MNCSPSSEPSDLDRFSYQLFGRLTESIRGNCQFKESSLCESAGLLGLAG